MAKKATDKPRFADDSHQTVIQQFEEFADAVSSNGTRALWEKCRNYRDGKQYTDDEIATLKKRKQPIITDNKIQDKCDTLAGIEKKMRTDPKCFPRNPSPQDEQAAEAATDALRFVADQCNYKLKARKMAAENLMIEGICAGQVIVEKRKTGYPTISMEGIHQDRVYYDIRSREDDFSDKRYCGYFTWMDEGAVYKSWPDAKEMIASEALDTSSLNGDQSYDDKPRYLLTSNKRKRIQVFKHYFILDGKWHEATWMRGGWLDEPTPCKYVDEFGDPACCMELQALYRDADGNPYGVVQRYLDLQDEHNKRRSKMMHLLSAKRAIYRAGVVTDVNKLRSEMHKPDGAIEINGNPDELVIQDNLAEAEGQWRLLQQTDAALSQTGPNNALAGTSGQISGVAKARDQQAGELPISPLFDALDGWELRMYRQAWCRVRQYWTAEMWVRVTDSDEKPKWVGLNQPVLTGERQAEALKTSPDFQAMPPDQQQEQIAQLAGDPAMQMQAVDDKTGRPLRRNEVAQLDIDIIIDRGNDIVTVQQEEFAMLSELAKTRPEVSFKTLLKLSGIRPTLKKQVLDELESGMNPQALIQAQQQIQQQGELLQQAQQQLQQEAQQLQTEKAALEKLKADIATGSANLKVQEANIKRDRAEFDAHVAQEDAKDAVEANSASQEDAQTAAEVMQQGLQAALANVQDQVSAILDQFAQQMATVPAVVAQVNAEQMAATPKRAKRSFRTERGPNGSMTVHVSDQMSDGTVQSRSIPVQRTASGFTGSLDYETVQ